MTAAAATPAKPRRRGIGIFALLLLCAAAGLALPTSLVAGIGLMPSWLAIGLGGSAARRGSGALMTVLPLNLCGVMMVLIKLWEGGSTTAHAIALLSDPVNSLVMFAAGGFGWLLLITLPPVFGGIIRTRLERRAEAVKTEQERLVDQWGEAIKGL